ncbi:universal stress protein [Variovorax sp. 22077]|uniref:universal stress protein n=1 Tax=Variovorax sp. 22077 TaxID=3453867 RepID=UPI003F8561F4
MTDRPSCAPKPRACLRAAPSACVRSAGVEVDTVLYSEADGTVASLVADEARGWHADLIIAGTRGRRGLGQLLLGSSTERIVRGTGVPVLLVHAAAGEQTAAG